MIKWDEVLLNKRIKTNTEKLRSRGLQTCPHCKSSFYLTSFYQKFCSKQCKKNAYEEKQNGLFCIICEEPLMGRNKRWVP